MECKPNNKKGVFAAVFRKNSMSMLLDQVLIPVCLILSCGGYFILKQEAFSLAFDSTLWSCDFLDPFYDSLYEANGLS